jgi:hypothetical protein
MFVGSLAVIPLDGGATAVISGIAFWLAGVRKVVDMHRLMKENTGAATALEKRVEHLSHALQEQANAPGKVTMARYSALARTELQLDLIKVCVEGVLPQKKEKFRRCSRLRRFRREPQVAVELAAHGQALSDLAADLGIVIGADVAAVVHSGVQ